MYFDSYEEKTFPALMALYSPHRSRWRLHADVVVGSQLGTLRRSR